MDIVVGLSGGVDSAVTALLLKHEGHRVIGATMRLWDGEAGESERSGACYGPGELNDIEDIRAICSKLDIPLHEIDCSRQYKEIVLEYFKSEYKAGRTPNPCVRCNHQVKFGLLPELLGKSGISFDRFATGHYARIHYDSAQGWYFLRQAADAKKDQTYFLYRLDQAQLAKTIFPLGELTKPEVRAISREHDLPVFDKEESQDFYEGDYGELIGEPPSPGAFRNMEGRVVGNHKGIWNYTIGQRKGLGLTTGEPVYVVGIDAPKNEIVVGGKDALMSSGLIAADYTDSCRRISGKVAAKIRSSQPESPCSVRVGENEIVVEFDEPQMAVTPGQAIVFYDKGLVVGGATIKEKCP